MQTVLPERFSRTHGAAEWFLWSLLLHCIRKVQYFKATLACHRLSIKKWDFVGLREKMLLLKFNISGAEWKYPPTTAPFSFNLRLQCFQLHKTLLAVFLIAALVTPTGHYLCMDLGFKSAEDYMNLCMCNTPPVKLLMVMGKEAAGDSMCIRGRARLCRRTAGGFCGTWGLAFTNREMCGGVGLLEGVGKKKANEINVEKDKKPPVIHSPHIVSNTCTN